MLVEAGHFAPALALGLSLLQFAVPLWGTRTSDPTLMGVAAPVALAVFACVTLAFVKPRFDGAITRRGVVDAPADLNIVPSRRIVHLR